MYYYLLSRLMRRLPAIRTLLASVLICVMLLGTVGIPFPRLVQQDASLPYPCQHGRCGCRNAETCWRSCCCHTNREKLAWAKKNGVQPPSYVIAAAARENDSPKKACCAQRTQKPNTLAAATCEAKTIPTVTKQVVTNQSAPVQWQWAQWEDYHRCRGSVPHFMLLTTTLWNHAPTWELDLPLAGDQLPIHSQRLESQRPQPTTPPPECMS